MPVINHRRYKFRKANYDVICQHLEQIDWKFIDEIPIDLAIERFYSIVNETIRKFIPTYNGKSDYPFWFDNALKFLLRKKHRARLKWKKSGNSDDYVVFSKLRSESKKKLLNAMIAI